MGQWWNLFNIDKRQKAKKVRRGFGEFSEYIFSGHDWLVKLLAPPDFPDTIPSVFLSPSKYDEGNLISLLLLPAELHAAIFAYIPSLDDAACLAATHRRLAAEGCRRVLQLRREECAYWGSWAGDRIIAAGSYTRRLPDNVLTPAEEAEMSMEGATHFYSFAYHHYERLPPALYDRKFDSEGGYVQDENGAPAVMGQEGDKPAIRRVSRKSDYLRVRLLLESSAPRYSSQGSWALCNTSRRLYVRASALASLKIPQTSHCVEGPFMKGKDTAMDLGTLAIILTTWSSVIRDFGTVGPWAGDRLAVTVVEELEDAEGWDDVTAMGLEVVKECVMVNDRAL
ncbi:hypothetical protein PENSPDRAFT_655521 [Peniophora sp. CONT]|nr:hypothetical protein PENSPDRAFT_655521 [Peniophora sp. CONT]